MAIEFRRFAAAYREINKMTDAAPISVYDKLSLISGSIQTLFWLKPTVTSLHIPQPEGWGYRGFNSHGL
jgi:hypothetical protein